ncbi:futalosine hydrolase [Deinococcus aquiradiocola]|uniref:Futalosine hydrolase n=1 Tax=Deinococcus aquiradiocola TaxID=393059 RepID=A0A917PCX5_9DEIO|nr:futalosine hydrolase [Deinococcus aquiradiocola]GGJ71421.1 Futalosine hydrolase [Deinococcus aquiradiocola]
MNVLIVVATPAEAARLTDLPARTVVSGVGPVAAALATQAALLAGPTPDLVISAGIGGAFPGTGLAVGGVAVANEMLYGDLGAWDDRAFLPLSDLGLSVLPALEAPGTPVQAGRFAAWEGAPAFAARLGVPCGPFVTMSGVTGSEAQASELQGRVQGALMEGMEGAGVAHAAHLSGVPCTEVRGVSNMVGPRDRAAWQIGPALHVLHAALRALLQPAPLETGV